MTRNNITMLQIVAEGLKDLNDSVVYVGGSVAELYANDPAATDIRPTMDIDCVIELTSYLGFNELSSTLQSKGFKNDQTTGSPICRWIYNGITVDIMPDDENILGFTNSWYKSGISHKEQKQLPDGQTIYIFPTVYYVATKLEALFSRGGKDIRGAHDFEDIVYILNNCPDFLEQHNRSNNPDLKTYLKEKFTHLKNRPNFAEEIECVLPIGEEERIEIIQEIIQIITD